MIYLIGVRHSIQSNGPNDASESRRTAFSEYIKSGILKYQILLLAEEFNEESVAGHHGTDSTVRLVANELEIEHRFCEPNTLEREKLGIPTSEELVRQLGVTPKLQIAGRQVYLSEDIEKIDQENRKYFPVREGFWLEKIKDRVGENILFICGASHLDSFAQILKNQNILVTILETKFHL